jgi:outer membrane protein OmpA-like peptidoglycan-associated protein
MAREKKVIYEPPQKAPVYIITFSTLAALLLAFFVVLISMGSVRDDTLLDEGQGGGWSFLESFKAGFGGTKSFGEGRTNYYHSIDNPEKDAEGRTIDAKGERARRALKQLASVGAMQPSPFNPEKAEFALTDIRFEADETTINETGRQFLKDFCTGLQQDRSSGQVKLCVLCITGRSRSSQKDWLIAARRAKAVEDIMTFYLPAGDKWTVYSWATGPEGIWLGEDQTLNVEPKVLIAILRSGR